MSRYLLKEEIDEKNSKLIKQYKKIDEAKKDTSALSIKNSSKKYLIYEVDNFGEEELRNIYYQGVDCGGLLP